MPPHSKVGGRRPGSGRPPVTGVARTKTRTVKLTPAERDAHDAARGTQPWADWIRQAAESAIARGSR